MKIAVCVKIVDGELNPFDECALEEALKIENAQVYVVSMCSVSAKEKLHSLTRLGVEKVYLLSDNVFAGSDTLATAYILSELLKRTGFDLIFCGRQTTDGDTAQVGPCLSAILKTGLITNVMKINNISDKIYCTTRLGEESSSLPALITVERINTLRFPSIRSKLGDIELIDNNVLCADIKKCGISGSPTKVVKTFENSSGMRKCRFIEACEFKKIFSDALNAKDKKIQIKESESKLDSVWAVGNTVFEKAALISKNVKIINEKEPEMIAELALKEKPDVILWNADLWGRRTAPQVAALLKTGLCADCTNLETDGKKLYMYRPAKSGNIIAKIECRTKPQMATVRCSDKTDDIIVSAGRGVSEYIDAIKSFAKKINADFCTSRPLVDQNLAPYECQIGLTGKNVSPKIYIAIGISGAVQHICAIENSGVVIAINPDMEAPIFKYADYGIIADFDNFLNNY